MAEGSFLVVKPLCVNAALEANWVKIGKKLRTASLSSKFIGTYEKKCNAVTEVFNFLNIYFKSPGHHFLRSSQQIVIKIKFLSLEKCVFV